MPWSLSTRIAFRFSVAYFSLYVVFTQMLGGLIVLPVGSLPRVGNLLNGLIEWTGAHVFHVVAKPIVSGSGDKMYDWVQAFCLLVIALVITATWSVIDRKRQSYDRTYRWFRVFLRFALGSTMLGYGFAKVFPLQMPAPPLTRLLEPFGNFSPMGVLWYGVGASFPYERFVGSMEVLAGALLFVPRLSTIGAIVALLDAGYIFILNMTYDVPVKLFSFHLILMSFCLLAPQLGALVRTLCAHGARRRWAKWAQVAFGAYLIGMGIYGARQSWYGPFGWGSAKTPLYGVWVIDKMTIDGIERAPLVTDYARWRRVVIDRPTTIVFWRMDDTTMGLGATMDLDAKTIAIRRTGGRMETLTFDRPAPDRTIFDGTMDGRKLHMETHLVRREDFYLISRGFHWIQEFPVNR